MIAWLEITAPGRLSLSQRGIGRSELRPEAVDDTWGHRDILDDVEVPAVEATLMLDDDPAGITLQLAAWHVEDADGGAWHPALRIRLSREDARRLRDFLGFVLAGEPS